MPPPGPIVMFGPSLASVKAVGEYTLRPPPTQQALAMGQGWRVSTTTSQVQRVRVASIHYDLPYSMADAMLVKVNAVD